MYSRPLDREIILCVGDKEGENVSRKIGRESGELLSLPPLRQELQTFWTGVSMATALLNVLKRLWYVHDLDVRRRVKWGRRGGWGAGGRPGGAASARGLRRGIEE